MTGVVLVSHGHSSVSMLDTAAQMLGSPLPGVAAVATEFREEVASIHTRIEAAIKGVEQGGGVLLIVDLCGSTPSNVCVGLARSVSAHPLDVLYGLSLPMLAKLSTSDRTQGPSALGRELQESARKNIRLTSETTRVQKP